LPVRVSSFDGHFHLDWIDHTVSILTF
jgi:hypothetical protein